MKHAVRTPPGFETFVYNDELYMRRKSGLAQDAIPSELGYDTPPRRKAKFSASEWGKQCTAKALRSQGLAMDAADPEPEESQGWAGEWDDEDTEEACKAFGVDKWKAFRKARDARKLRAAARDEPPDFPGKPERAGASDAMVPGSLAEADYLRRYPNSFRIGRDDGYGRPVRPEPSREMSAAEQDAYYKRFPGAARFKVR